MNSYDALPYPGLPYRQTHPDRLRTIARLLGMDPPSAERCRVLELGCGDGGNLSNASAVEAGGEMTEFRGQRSSLKTDHPVVQAVLRTLAQAWPRSVSIAALHERIGRSHVAVIAQVLLSAFSRDLVEIYSTPPLVASEPGDRPEATPLARLQALQGEKISTLVHTYIAVEDDRARHLIGLLDGTRDRAALIAELAPRAPRMSRDQLGQQIDDYLAALCRWAVLRP